LLVCILRPIDSINGRLLMETLECLLNGRY
jgi:hypothetical protein